MGAGILTNYLCREKDNSPLTAAAPLACHFDTFKAMEFLSQKFYGLYDYGLAYFCKSGARCYFRYYDELIVKHYPDRVAVEENERVMTLSGDFSRLVARVSGYRSVKEYFSDCTVTHRLKDVKVPSFFLSAVDDPLYGPYVIPYD